jgi:hypothetical protein
MAELQQRIAAARADGLALLAALRAKISGLDLPTDTLVIPEFDAAEFSLEYDKYNGEKTLMASFYPRPRYRAGVLLFHSDGSCFAEYHVMCRHPAKPQYFIESVEAWSRDGQVRADLRLAMMPV